MDASQLQVLASRLRGLTEEMGIALIRSARSANIKERRDCSTAIFDPNGEMVAQAEHQPSHLGAMPASVAACIAIDPEPGDVVLLNDPYMGGSHLPDLTLVSPIYNGDRLIGYAASRAHHADVGGAEPGSMPAGVTSIHQEGVRIPPLRLVRRGSKEAGIVELLLANMRNPAERLGDLEAQLAAHRVAERRLRELSDRYGAVRLLAGMDELLAYSERWMRAGIQSIPNGIYRSEDFMEGDGNHLSDIPIRVQITVHDETVEVDFADSAPQQEGNVNCPLAVTKGACYFALRVLFAPDLPAAGGAFRPVSVVAPVGSFLHVQYPGPVAAGNVETASRIADTVLRAFNQKVPFMAQGQGTMNNLTFGNAGFSYYETIGGGQGASRCSDGADAVHVAMSNTQNTPVEALELEYPLRVERYAVRRGSGGNGQFRGGEGVVRSIRVLEPSRLSILSERRKYRPAGAAGGEPGQPGRNMVNGEVVPAKTSRSLNAGDVVTIETPGGGGFGTRVRSKAP